MQIVNLTAQDVLDGIQAPKINGKYWGDYYRKFADFDKDNVLGLYYKQLDYKKNDIQSLDRRILDNKECCDFEYTWEYYSMGHLFSLVNRLEETYEEISDTTALKSPIITGIALYKNFPVGTLFPRELLDYKSLYELTEASEEGISDSEKVLILIKAKSLLEHLIDHNVYFPRVTSSNIIVNPNDHSDVRFDGVDNPGFARVESEYYVKKLVQKGLDLRKNTIESFDKDHKISRS